MAISSAIAPSDVARATAVKTTYKDARGAAAQILPQRLGLIGQGATASTYSTDKKQVFSALEVGQTYGFGSPLHLMALQVLPTNGDGVGTIPVTVYPLVDDASGVAASGSITPVVGTIVPSEYTVKISNIESAKFTTVATDTVATLTAKLETAINAVVEMPMIATDGTTVLDLDAKWEGVTGNKLYIEVDGPTTGGITWTIVQPASGAADPDIDSAIAQIGNVWETMLVNQMDTSNTDALDALSVLNEGRWLPLVKRPFVSFNGAIDTTVSAATIVTDARKTDRTNSQLINVAANDLPCVVAARQVARIIKVANENPATGYGAQKATGLTPGADADQWDYTEQNDAVLAGSSTMDSIDGQVSIGDVVTMYHPTGDPLPPYRYVVTIVKLQNIIYNLDLIFSADEWAAAPLIPDDQPTTNKNAKKPKMAVAAVAKMVDDLGLLAIISDPAAVKETIVAGINETNPNRLDVSLNAFVSGNTNQKSIDLNFSFFFGTPEVVG